MRAVGMTVSPRIIAHARPAADRRLHVEPIEPNAPGRQRVDVGGVEVGMACTAEIVVPQLIEHDEQDVLGFSGHEAPSISLARTWPEAAHLARADLTSRDCLGA